MSKQKRPTAQDRMDAIRSRREERRAMLESERQAKEKVRAKLDECACELELALECLKGLPVGDDQAVTAVERSGQSPMQVRVLFADPEKNTMLAATYRSGNCCVPGGSAKMLPVPTSNPVLIGFLVHHDPTSGRSWYAYGSQTVTADEAVHLVLDEIERRQK